jgi:signal transduction histidine kinase
MSRGHLGDSETMEVAAHPEQGLLLDAARAAPSSARLQATLGGFLVILLFALSGMTFYLVTRIFDRLTPAVYADLQWKVQRGARELAHDADLALALGDGGLAQRAFGDYRHSPDVVAIVAATPRNLIVAVHGMNVEPVELLFSGAPGEVRDTPDHLVAWAPAVIEGQEVGRVALVISKERLLAGRKLRRDILVLAGVGGVAALLLGLFFVRFYLGPLLGLLHRVVTGLRELTANLEERVKHRTTELSRSKEKLETSLGELHAAQRQLVEASRLTGMAEVATSVLHNVGNVLNSANVSSQLVMDTLQRSRSEGLSKAVLLLRAHEHDLGGLLASGKGKQLVAFLDALAKQQAAERDRMLGELEALSKNIDHIKVIVTMQQTHARPGGVTEIVNLAELVEDAVSMNQVACDQEGIEIERRCDPFPDVTLDRHKLMQILMNLRLQRPPRRQQPRGRAAGHDPDDGQGRRRRDPRDQRQRRRDPAGEHDADLRPRLHHQEGGSRVRVALVRAGGGRARRLAGLRQRRLGRGGDRHARAAGAAAGGPVRRPRCRRPPSPYERTLKSRPSPQMLSSLPLRSRRAHLALSDGFSCGRRQCVWPTRPPFMRRFKMKHTRSTFAAALVVLGVGSTVVGSGVASAAPGHEFADAGWIDGKVRRTYGSTSVAPAVAGLTDEFIIGPVHGDHVQDETINPFFPYIHDHVSAKVPFGQRQLIAIRVIRPGPAATAANLRTRIVYKDPDTEAFEGDLPLLPQLDMPYAIDLGQGFVDLTSIEIVYAGIDAGILQSVRVADILDITGWTGGTIESE